MNSKKLSLIIAIIAGEAIFMLPFLIPRLYRPLMLDAWSLTNTQIGLAFSAYGLSAMFSYIIGGPFADKYHPRFLMAISLIMTSIAGISLVYFHGPNSLIFTYFLFGISTTFLMWGALIKLTHDVGGEDQRASAMGILDAGRGLTAAIISSLLIIAVSMLINTDDINSKKQSLSLIYALVSAFNLLVGLIVLYGLKGISYSTNSSSKWTLKDSITVLKKIEVWLLGIIILSCYCGYKSVDNYSIYLVDILGFNLKESSYFTSLIFWLRPISALLAGFLADYVGKKYKAGRFLNLFWILLLASVLQFFMTTKIQSLEYLILFVILTSSALSYALRAVYFAVFGDLNIPNHLIGTTVGIVSLVGFLPDMFFGSLTGYLIDTYTGLTGYNYVFVFTGLAMMIGSICAYICYKRSNTTS
jgi:MFS family permease